MLVGVVGRHRDEWSGEDLGERYSSRDERDVPPQGWRRKTQPERLSNELLVMKKRGIPWSIRFARESDGRNGGRTIPVTIDNWCKTPMLPLRLAGASSPKAGGTRPIPPAAPNPTMALPRASELKPVAPACRTLPARLMAAQRANRLLSGCDGQRKVYDVDVRMQDMRPPRMKAEVTYPNSLRVRGMQEGKLDGGGRVERVWQVIARCGAFRACRAVQGSKRVRISGKRE